MLFKHRSVFTFVTYRNVSKIPKMLEKEQEMIASLIYQNRLDKYVVFSYFKNASKDYHNFFWKKLLDETQHMIEWQLKFSTWDGGQGWPYKISYVLVINWDKFKIHVSCNFSIEHLDSYGDVVRHLHQTFILAICSISLKFECSSVCANFFYLFHSQLMYYIC